MRLAAWSLVAVVSEAIRTRSHYDMKGGDWGYRKQLGINGDGQIDLDDLHDELRCTLTTITTNITNTTTTAPTAEIIDPEAVVRTCASSAASGIGHCVLVSVVTRSRDGITAARNRSGELGVPVRDR